MRTQLDVMRSLARYTASILWTDKTTWDVRTATEGGTFARPAVTVQNAGPSTLDGTVRRVDAIQPYVVNAFPEAAATVDEGEQIAYEAADRLERAYSGGHNEGFPWLVPLYDYEGVARDETTDARTIKDFGKVRDLTVRPVQSPSDELLWTINCEVRIGWSRIALLPSDARVTKAVLIEITGT